MGKLGLGSFGMALTVSDTYLDEAAELERLGYSAIWLPGAQIDSLGRLADVIGATSVDKHEPAAGPGQETADWQPRGPMMAEELRVRPRRHVVSEVARPRHKRAVGHRVQADVSDPHVPLPRRGLPGSYP